MVIRMRDNKSNNNNKPLTKLSNENVNLNQITTKSKSDESLNKKAPTDSSSPLLSSLSFPSMTAVKKLKISSSSSSTLPSSTSSSSSTAEPSNVCSKIIGNLKEIRINTNRNHLRIVGNSNKIRIGNNYGTLDIVGNGINLKIVKNFGQINCTGNNYKIYFGSESLLTDVDYTGNNGILKVINGLIIKRTDNEFNSNDFKTSSKSFSSSLNHYKNDINKTIDKDIKLNLQNYNCKNFNCNKSNSTNIVDNTIVN